MKTKSFFLILILSVFVGHIAFGQKQKFTVPENYSFEKNEDYKKYANDIVKCVDWLEKTGIKEDDRNYNEAVNFMGEWVSGCPYTNFSKNMRIDAVFNDCPQLRIFFMGGWAKNAIENRYRAGKVENYLAGLRSAIKVYKANKSLNRSDSIDELIKLDSTGKLKEWVTDRL
jgi:hypothetical protein